MNKTYIIIIVIILAIIALFFVMKSKKIEAPVILDQNEVSGVDTSAGDTPTTSTTQTEFEGIVATTPAVKEFTVSAKNFSFDPSTITVNKGDRVKITFKNSEGFHDFVVDEFGAATKQVQAPATEVIEFTADKNGQFEYYCSVGSHRAMGMKGVLKVQ